MPETKYERLDFIHYEVFACVGSEGCGALVWTGHRMIHSNFHIRRVSDPTIGPRPRRRWLRRRVGLR